VITLERQVGQQRCEVCDADFAVVSGSVLEDGHPFGSFIVGLHGHLTEGRRAQLAVALLDRREPEASPIAVALDVSATPREFRMSVVDWAESPWAGETYLGKMLDKADVVDNRLRPVVLDMVNRVLSELPEVRSYFA
jgi:hypothetical protein